MLLSLLDSLISSIVLSVVAVALLNYFFVEPLFTLQVEYAQDSAALIVFVITSIVITSLVRRVRNLANTQREQGRLLDLTRDTIIVRGMDDAITYWNPGPIMRGSVQQRSGRSYSRDQRERLRASGERVQRLPALPYPPTSAHLRAAEAMAFPAVELCPARRFCRRAARFSSMLI